MNSRLVISLCLCFAVYVSAFSWDNAGRYKRDVVESVKSALNEAGKGISDAGDAVVGVFKPTEKSIVDKVVDGAKSLTPE